LVAMPAALEDGMQQTLERPRGGSDRAADVTPAGIGRKPTLARGSGGLRLHKARGLELVPKRDGNDRHG
jgi:hypothetical protein